MNNKTTTTQTSELESLLQEGDFLNVPNLGDLITTTVISTKGREIRVDISGLTTGVVRGRELFSESDLYSGLKPGDKVEATVIELENENGEMELSFRFAGNKKAWEDLESAYKGDDPIKVKIIDANKGGLIVKARHLSGFLPVSQLAPENYPRVSGGDKQKILEKLKEFIGQSLSVKVLDMSRNDEKLILSEKAVWEAEQRNIISQISAGDTVEGEVTALADFGAFVKFKPVSGEDIMLEGLVHISEIAWQRIDHPRDILKVGQTVNAQIIGIEGSKIFLSMKQLVADPWSEVEKRYKVGDVVEGTVLKINPFGFFVELDPEIHGLAHISELDSEPVKEPGRIAKPGDVRKFKIVSIEPKEHRLGLSIKALDEDKKEEKEPKGPKKSGDKEGGEDTGEKESESKGKEEEKQEEEDAEQKEKDKQKDK